MPLPENKPRRKRNGPGKLEKELWLYKTLRDDYSFREDHVSLTGGGEEDLLGVPISELIRFLAPDSNEWSFLRTLNRYLRELEACGAVTSARIRSIGGKRYCLADIPEKPPPADRLPGPDTPANPAGLHLARLGRTVRLMDLWFRRWGGVENLPEEYDPARYTEMFFDSRREAEEWYFDYENVSDLDGLYAGSGRSAWLGERTMKRDMLAVWTAINLYE